MRCSREARSAAMKPLRMKRQDRIDDVQIRVVQRTLKTDPRCNSVPPLVLAELRDRFGSPCLHFPSKVAVRGGFQLEMIENRFGIPVDLAIGRCRLHKKDRRFLRARPLPRFSRLLYEVPLIDAGGLKIEVECRRLRQRITLHSQFEAASRHHSGVQVAVAINVDASSGTVSDVIQR